MKTLSEQAFEIGYEASAAGRPCIVAMNVEINLMLEGLQGNDQHETRMMIMNAFRNGVNKQTDEQLACEF